MSFPDFLVPSMAKAPKIPDTTIPTMQLDRIFIWDSHCVLNGYSLLTKYVRGARGPSGPLPGERQQFCNFLLQNNNRKKAIS